MDNTCRGVRNYHGREHADEEEEEDGVEDGVEDEVDYADIIERNHLEIVTNLDLDRQFVISYLRGKSVLDEEDCDLVRNTGNTRQQKVSIFLDTIKRKGPIGMKHFIDSLEYEHPQLYEQCTGKKATVAMPSRSHVTNGVWNWTTGLADKELIDFDRMILAKQLEQTVSDLHWITRSLHKAQEEKNIVEKHYIEANNKIDMQQQHITELKEIIEKTAAVKRLVDENSLGNTEAIAQAQFLQLAIQQEIVQKTNMIIALQGKLLAQTEEIDDIRAENSELKTSNNLFKKEIFDLTLICDNERRNSKRLNEKVQTQHGEMKQVDSYKIMNRDLKLRLSCMAEERDDLKRELEEFRKYSEILNAKYTMINEEKCKLKEHKEEISFSFLNVKDQINEANVKCTALECDNAYLLRNNKRYQNDIKTYSENQKLLHEERERLMKERDEAWDAAETAQRDLLNYKREHDEAIHNQMIINSALDAKYRDAVEEFEDMRSCLRQTNEELVLTKKRLGSELSRSSGSFTTFESLDATDAEQSQKNKQVDTSHSPEESESSDDEKIEPNFAIPFKKRDNKDLLDSIKRKVSGEEDTHFHVEPKSKSLPAKGLMSFDQIFMLYSTDRTHYADKSVHTISHSPKRNEHLSVVPDIRRTSATKSSNYIPLSSVRTDEETRKKEKDYIRSISDENVPRVQRETSEESVFESSFNGSLQMATLLNSTCKRKNAVRRVGEEKTSVNQKSGGSENTNNELTDQVKNGHIRKRSILVDTQAWNRERSASTPVTPVYNCFSFEKF